MKKEILKTFQKNSKINWFINILQLSYNRNLLSEKASSRALGEFIALPTILIAVAYVTHDIFYNYSIINPFDYTRIFWFWLVFILQGIIFSLCFAISMLFFKDFKKNFSPLTKYALRTYNLLCIPLILIYLLLSNEAIGQQRSYIIYFFTILAFAVLLNKIVLGSYTYLKQKYTKSIAILFAFGSNLIFFISYGILVKFTRIISVEKLLKV